MNIEQGIIKAKTILDNHREIDKMMVIEMVELIETLLTAYEKEKEKREKLEYEATEAEEYIKELRKYIEKYKIRIPMPEEYYNRENWGEEIKIAQKEYIAVDKIKAKIEDKESQINDIKDNLDYDAVMVNEVRRLENEIEVLQSLLEKE